MAVQVAGLGGAEPGVPGGERGEVAPSGGYEDPAVAGHVQPGAAGRHRRQPAQPVHVRVHALADPGGVGAAVPGVVGVPVRGPHRRRGPQGQPVQAGRERARGQRAVRRRAADGHPQRLGRVDGHREVVLALPRVAAGRAAEQARRQPGAPGARVASPSTRHSRGPVDSTYSTVGSDGAAASPRLSSVGPLRVGGHAGQVDPVERAGQAVVAAPQAANASGRGGAGHRYPQPGPGRGAHPGQVGHVHPAAAAGQQRLPGGHGDQAPRLGEGPGGRIEAVQAGGGAGDHRGRGSAGSAANAYTPWPRSPGYRRRAGRRAPTGRYPGPAGRCALARWRAGSRSRRSWPPRRSPWACRAGPAPRCRPRPRPGRVVSVRAEADVQGADGQRGGRRGVGGDVTAQRVGRRPGASCYRCRRSTRPRRPPRPRRSGCRRR